jgi:hypothetical protein
MQVPCYIHYIFIYTHEYRIWGILLIYCWKWRTSIISASVWVDIVESDSNKSRLRIERLDKFNGFFDCFEVLVWFYLKQFRKYTSLLSRKLFIVIMYILIKCNEHNSLNLGLVHPVAPLFNENHKSIDFVSNLSRLYCTQYNTTLHVSAITIFRCVIYTKTLQTYSISTLYTRTAALYWIFTHFFTHFILIVEFSILLRVYSQS